MTVPSSGVLAKIVAAVSVFFVGLKHDALNALTGILPRVEGELADEVRAFGEQQLEKLLHALAELPAGATIERIAEGWGVKIIGNGLPRHGFGATLLGAIEEALGIPSHVMQPPAPPAPAQPEAAAPAAPAAPASTSSSESVVEKVENVAVAAAVSAVEKVATGESVLESLKETAEGEIKALLEGTPGIAAPEGAAPVAQ